MGRPSKVTLDFFLHDARASADIKIRSLRRMHGNDGYATYFTLLELCCSEEGMKIGLKGEINAQVVALECALRDAPHLYKVIQSCADIGLFNKQLWESERIVFSDSLHSRYVERLEVRKSDAQRKRQGRLAKKLQEQIDSLDHRLSVVTTGLSQESPKGCPRPEEETEGELELERELDTQRDPGLCVEVQPVHQNKLLGMGDRWAARKANRKGSPFDDAWEQYQRNCIVVDRSPGNKAQASTAWRERFPKGPTPEFLHSLDVYWQQQLNKFKAGQQCIGVVGMVRFISEPEHAEQAIARQQLLEQAPQLADPKATAQALKQQEEDRMWADLKAKGAA
jgi:hypothetical protein